MKFIELLVEKNTIVLKNKVGEMDVVLKISSGIVFEYQKLIRIRENGKVLFEEALEIELADISSLVEASVGIGYDLTVIKNP